MAEHLASFPSLASSGPSSIGSEGHVTLGEEDPEFVNEADTSRFLCPVHKGVLRDTRQTVCGHRLCARCVDVWLNGATSKRCPVGESDCNDVTAQNVFPDRSIQREMKNVLVYCKNKKEGCQHKVKLRDLQSHLEGCEFERVDCEYCSRGCKEKLLRGKATEHREQCQFRPVRCRLCQEEVSQNQLQHHEAEICLEKVIGCPFGCGNKTLKKKDVGDCRNIHPSQLHVHRHGLQICRNCAPTDGVIGRGPQRCLSSASSGLQIQTHGLQICQQKGSRGEAREGGSVRAPGAHYKACGRTAAEELGCPDAASDNFCRERPAAAESAVIKRSRRGDTRTTSSNGNASQRLQAETGVHDGEGDHHGTQDARPGGTTKSGGDRAKPVWDSAETAAAGAEAREGAAAAEWQRWRWRWGCWRHIKSWALWHSGQHGKCHPYTASRTRPTAGCARRPHGRNGPSLPTAGNGLLRWHPCLENSRLRASEERCSEWTDTVLVQPAILLQPFWLQDVCQGLPEWRWHGQDDAHVSLLCRDARRVRCLAELAVPAEGDLDLAGPVHREATPNGSFPTRSQFVQFPATNIGDERSQRMPTVCLPRCAGEPRQRIPERRHHLHPHCCGPEPKPSSFLARVGLGELDVSAGQEMGSNERDCPKTADLSCTLMETAVCGAPPGVKPLLTLWWMMCCSAMASALSAREGCGFCSSPSRAVLVTQHWERLVTFTAVWWRILSLLAILKAALFRERLDSLNASRLLWQTTVAYHLPAKGRALKCAHTLHRFLSSLSNSPPNPILFCQLTLVECLPYSSVLHGRVWFVVMRNICNDDYGESWIVLNHLLGSTFSVIMVEQPPRSCVPLGTPSRWWGCYAIYLRSSRLPTRQLCVRCAQAYSHRGIQHIRNAFGFCRCIVTKLAHSFLLCSCHLFLSLWSSAIFYSINSPNSTHPDITVPEPLLDC